MIITVRIEPQKLINVIVAVFSGVDLNKEDKKIGIVCIYKTCCPCTFYWFCFLNPVLC